MLKTQGRNLTGFSLIELMLTIAILSIIAILGRDFYFNYQRSVQIDATARSLISDLRRTRDRAMYGETDRNWGVRLANQSSDYYEIFSSATDYSNPLKTITDTVYLPQNVYFNVPAEGVNLDLIFTKISGTTTAASATLSSLNDATATTINITANGKVD